MNCTFFQDKSERILYTAFAFFAVLYQDFGKNGKKQEYYKGIFGAPENMMGGRHFSSIDLNLARESPRGENAQHKFTFTYTLQGNRLLQACVFNRDKIVVLIQRLACLTQPLYCISLLPLSQPSIPIVYRKLII
jgi:hypothetical protein